jgi:hypothetical protein
MSSPTELLGREARRALLDITFDEVRANEPDFVFESHRRWRHLGAIALLRVRQNYPLTKLDGFHTQKMVAMEGSSAIRIIEKKGDDKFWRRIESEAGSYWAPARSFPRDLSKVPKNWEGARNDLLTLREFVKEEAERLRKAGEGVFDENPGN